MFQSYASIPWRPSFEPQAADGIDHSALGLMGLQVEFWEDFIAELHNSNSHFIGANVEPLDNPDDKVSDVCNAFNSHTVGAVNEEDNVGSITLGSWEKRRGKLSAWLAPMYFDFCLCF